MTDVLTYTLLIFCLVSDLRDHTWSRIYGSNYLRYTGAVLCLHLYTSTAVL